MDGDGRSDVMLRNTATGEIGFWFVKETGYAGAMFFGPIAANWQTQNHAIFAGGV